MNRLFKKVLLNVLIILILVLLIIITFSGWVIKTESGLHWVQDKIETWVSIENLSGTLSGGLIFKKMTLELPAFKVFIDSGSLAWSPLDLFGGRVVFNELTVNNIIVIETPIKNDIDKQKVAFVGINLPLDTEIKTLKINDFSYQPFSKNLTKSVKPLVIDEILLSAQVIDDVMTLHQLEIKHPQISLALNGSSNISSNILASTSMDANWSVIHQDQKITGVIKVIGNLQALNISSHISTPFSLDGSAKINDITSETPTWDINMSYENLSIFMLNKDFNDVSSSGHLSSKGSLKGWSTDSEIVLNENTYGITSTDSTQKQWLLSIDAQSRNTSLFLNKITFSEAPSTIMPHGKHAAFLIKGRLDNYLTLFNTKIKKLKENNDVIKNVNEQKKIFIEQQVTKNTEKQFKQTNQIDVAEGAFDIVASWQNIQWPLPLVLNQKNQIQKTSIVHSEQGRLNLLGTLQNYKLSLSSDLGNTQLGNNTVNLSGEGDTTHIDIDTFIVNGDLGSVSGEVKLSVLSKLSWDAHINLEQINLGRISSEWPGYISAQIQSSGLMSAGAPKGNISVQNLSGELRQREVRGQLVGDFDAHTFSINNLKLRSGKSVISASGQIGKSLSLVWDFDSPNLNDFSPDISGQLSSSGTISGLISQPNINMRMNAEELKVDSWFLKSLTGRVSLDFSEFHATQNQKQQPWGATLRLNGLLHGDNLIMENTTLELKGSRFDHKLTVESLTDNKDRQYLELTGKFPTEKWLATLNNLQLNHSRFGQWALKNPTKVEVSKTDFSIQDLCLGSLAQEFCAEIIKKEYVLSADMTVTDVMNQNFNFLLDEYQLSSIGTTSASLNLNKNLSDKNSAVNLLGELRSDGAELIYTPDPKNRNVQEIIKIPFEKIAINFSQNQVSKAHWDIRFAEKGIINGEMLTDKALTAATLNEVILSGSSQFSLTDLSIVPQSLLPQIELTDGSMEIDADISGKLIKPEIALNARLTESNITIIETGTQLSDVDLRIKSLSDFKLQMNGKVTMGKGMIKTQAFIDYSNPSQLVGELILKGDQLTIANSPDLFMVAGIDLSVALEPDLFVVNGKINFEEANIRVNQPAGVVKTSKDVIFENEEKNIYKFQQELDINLDLGDNTRVTASGFDGFLTGKTRIIQLPGGNPIGEGRISVKDAKFSIFSQILDIDKGELFYAGGAINNPQVSLEANKNIGTVKAGIRVTGRVQNPAVDMYSEPSMSDQNILSYLVFEKPVENIGVDDALTLVKIANSLRGESSGRLSGIKDKLSKGLGLTDFEINASGLDAGLRLGKQLSSRFYIGYGYEILDAVQTLFLRYNINDKWSIQSNVGTSNGGDIRYKIEHD